MSDAEKEPDYRRVVQIYKNRQGILQFRGTVNTEDCEDSFHFVFLELPMDVLRSVIEALEKVGEAHIHVMGYEIQYQGAWQGYECEAWVKCGQGRAKKHRFTI